MKHLLLFILLCTLQLPSYSQIVRTIETEYVVQVKGKVKYFSLHGFLPVDMPAHQRVRDISFSRKRVKVTEKNGKKYFHFITSNLEDQTLSIKIRYEIELFAYDLERAKLHKTLLADTAELEQYRRKSKYSQSESRKIRLISEQIEGKGELELVQNIFDFVLEALTYQENMYADLGAVKALKLGVGDCTEYSDLFVALCRAKGLPARVVTGRVTTMGQNPNHNWAEVYLQDVGWVPFDPTAADLDSTANTFSQLENKYIYYSKDRIDPKLQNTVGRSLVTRSFWRRDKGGSAQVVSYYKTIEHTENFIIYMVDAYKKGDYELAWINADELLESDPDNYYYLYYKALILAKLDKPDDALLLLQLALRNAETADKKAEVMYAYAVFLAMSGDEAPAISFLKSALEGGFSDYALIEKEAAFSALKNNAAFLEVTEALNGTSAVE